MPILINDNTAPLSTVNYYSRHTDERQKSVLKIASGIKINGVGDNPSDWGKNEKLREQMRSLEQADQNTQNDINLLKVADGAISSMVDIVHRLQEIAINSANDHNGETERTVMQYETNQLLAQFNNIATSTTFNGKRLLDGSQADEGLTFHIGGETNFSVQVKLESMTAESLGLTGIDVSTREGAASTLGTYNSDGTYTPSVYGRVLNKLLTQQGKIGAVEEQLGFSFMDMKQDLPVLGAALFPDPAYGLPQPQETGSAAEDRQVFRIRDGFADIGIKQGDKKMPAVRIMLLPVQGKLVIRHADIRQTVRYRHQCILHHLTNAPSAGCMGR